MDIQKATSILKDSDKDALAVIQAEVFENIQKSTLSNELKNKNYSGDATSGTVTVPRFINSVSADLGTARTAGKGTSLNDKGRVEIKVDTDKEIVEEVAAKDVKLSGIAGLFEARKANHTRRIAADLDRAFFKAQEDAATTVDLASVTTVEDKLEAIIQSIETTNNEYVDGVDRELIVLTLTPTAYGKVRNLLDKISNPNVDSATKEVSAYHGVRVFSNHRQTADVIASVEGSTAQLVTLDEYDAERIPLSHDIALEAFYSYGTKVVAPDLVKKATL